MKLDFPLNIDDKITILNSLFIKGTKTLVAGSATITNQKIQTSSIPMISYKTHSNQGTLRVSVSQGSITITSTSATDTSQVFYFIII